MHKEEQKVSFSQLDNFLKVAPILGICALAYLQTLFPSKQDFDKIHDTMHDVEKQVLQLTALQSNVSNNTIAITDLNKTIQQMRIDIVKLQKNTP